MNQQLKPGDIQKTFEERLKQGLLELKFPVDKIFPDFEKYARRALECKSAMSCNCDFESYAAMVTMLDPGTVSDWNIYHIANALNVIETTKPSELGLSIWQYLEVVRETRAMATIWNEIVEPVKNRIIEELKPKQPAPRNGKKVIPMNRNK